MGPPGLLAANMFVVGVTCSAGWTKTHAAPVAAPGDGLSSGPPTRAVLPSAESATETPCPARPIAPVPISLLPCWVHKPLLRVKTHAAPTTPLLGSELSLAHVSLIGAMGAS